MTRLVLYKARVWLLHGAAKPSQARIPVLRGEEGDIGTGCTWSLWLAMERRSRAGRGLMECHLLIAFVCRPCLPKLIYNKQLRSAAYEDWRVHNAHRSVCLCTFLHLAWLGVHTGSNEKLCQNRATLFSTVM